MGVYHVCVLIWLAYLWLPERVSQFAVKSVPEHDLETWNEELQRLIQSMIITFVLVIFALVALIFLIRLAKGRGFSSLCPCQPQSPDSAGRSPRLSQPD